jgi:hypothetical protein
MQRLCFNLRPVSQHLLGGTEENRENHQSGEVPGTRLESDPAPLQLSVADSVGWFHFSSKYPD